MAAQRRRRALAAHPPRERGRAKPTPQGRGPSPAIPCRGWRPASPVILASGWHKGASLNGRLLSLFAARVEGRAQAIG